MPHKSNVLILRCAIVVQATVCLGGCGHRAAERTEVADAASDPASAASPSDLLSPDAWPQSADVAPRPDLAPVVSEVGPSGFVHPGVIIDHAVFSALENAHNAEPQRSAWTDLTSRGAGASGVFTSASYRPHALDSLMFVTGGNSVGFRELVGWDAPAAHHNALAWAVTRDPAYAEKVMQLLDAWATKNPVISGQVNQMALDVSKALSSMVFAEELVKRTYPGWDPAVEARWRAFVTNRCLPRIDSASAWQQVLKNGRTMMIRANMMIAIAHDDAHGSTAW